jgi:signal transduction histidine kinase
MRSLLSTLAGLGVGLTLAASLLAAWLSRRIVDPIERIARAAEEVDPAAPAVPLPRREASDEIDRLAVVLDATFARLHAAWERQARFTADASHELRTPLALVRTEAEVALRRDRLTKEYKDVLIGVVEGATRMHDTLEGLLLLARADTAPVQRSEDRVDLRDVAVAAALEFADRAAGPTVRVEPGDPAPMLGDARQLDVLVRNLLSNAVRHTPGAGEVVVEVRAEGSDVVLTVRDTGEGIPADAVPRVFERFYRVDEARDRAGGGAGLGLSIVEAVVRAHGGRVGLTSERGRGTVVEVRLLAVRSAKS